MRDFRANMRLKTTGICGIITQKISKTVESRWLKLKAIVCEKCGSNNWAEIPGFRKCKFCGTIYQLTAEDQAAKESNIDIRSDVRELLKKCETDPMNAKKYANLVLDIDPTNGDAMKYL